MRRGFTPMKQEWDVRKKEHSWGKAHTSTCQRRQHEQEHRQTEAGPPCHRGCRAHLYFAALKCENRAK